MTFVLCEIAHEIEIPINQLRFHEETSFLFISLMAPGGLNNMNTRISLDPHEERISIILSETNIAMENPHVS